MSSKVFLTYCSENKDVVGHFAADLGRAGINFIHDTRDGERNILTENQMSATDAPIFLFVSDNFLKSVECMEGALKFIDNFKFRPRIKPIVIDGVHRNEDTGEIDEIPTKFDKVSNVIRYMNYWQDEYLRLRREKRTIPYSEEAAFQSRIDRIRRISNEIGEFLRSLRGFNYLTYEQFRANNSERFFSVLGFDGNIAKARYSSLPELPFRRISYFPTEIEVPEIAEVPEIEIPDTPIPSFQTPIEEEKTLPDLVEENEDEDQGDKIGGNFTIDGIPGLDLLPEEEDEDEEEEEESGAAPADELNDQAPSDSYQTAEEFIQEVVEEEVIGEEVIEETVESVEEVVENVEESAEEVIEEKVESVESVVENVEESAEEVIEETEEIVESVVENVEESAEEVIEETVESVESVVENVEEAAEEAIEETVEIVESVVENVEEAAEEAIEETKESVESVVENAEESAEEAIEETKESVEAVVENAEESAEEAIEETEEIVEAVVENAEESAEEAIEETEEIVEAVVENVEESVEKVIEEAYGSAEEVIENVESEIEEEIEETEESVESVVENVEESAEEAIEETVEIVESVVENVEELAEEEIEETEEIVESVVENMEELAEEVIEETEKSVESVVENAEESAEEVIEETVESAESVVENVEESAEEAIEELTIIRTPAMILAEAETYAVTGNYTAAKENYQLLLTKSNDSKIKLQYAAVLQDHLNDEGSAKEYLEELLLEDKANSEVYYRLGLIAEENGEFQLAKDYYERVISEDSSYGDAYHRLGLIMYNNFENQKFVAKSYLEEAITIDGDNPSYRYDFATFLTSEGNYKKARKQLSKAIDLDEDDAQAHFALAQLYKKHLGKKKKARKYYLKAIGLDEAFSSSDNDATFGIEREAEPEPEEMAANLTEVKTVLVTGATSGIGLAIAESFAAQGHRVVLTGRRAERLEAIQAAFLENYGNEPQILAFDVREKEAVKTALESLTDEWKEVDILVNNAGLAKGFNSIHEGSLDHWETMIDTNLKGLLYVTRLVSPWMVERGNGHIINIGSSAGKEVYPNGNVYCATKFGVDALTKGMRLDLHKYGVRVTAIHPGHVETEFALVRFDGDEERSKIYNDFQPLTAQDVAETVVFAATRPPHVNIENLLLFATQQASNFVINRNGRTE